MTRIFKTAPEAVARGRDAGIYGDTEKRLQRMAARSAPVTSPHGNRRYQGYVLRIEGDLITDVCRLTDQAGGSAA
ncbi:MAG: hypothetical protein M9945_14100 [Aquamicrobium sp.]|uniref:hypothetical protein n=1 Tax=Aquamicrobium sp. TaxID=1872579 RepID=UPI00349E981E|nr:hypothetical protein [Aquamicrobium sp.]